MTTDELSLNDPEALRQLLANTEALLLDFEGPVCSVFAGIPACRVADRLREVLADGGRADLPPDVERSEDPFDVFRYAAKLGEFEASLIEASLQAHEVEAVRTAKPTSSAHRLIESWHSTGRKSAIVSNNSEKAVRSYLKLHGLTTSVDYVSARTTPNPAILKPASYLVLQAVELIGAPSSKCTLVGDAATDIIAAHAAGVRAVGFANKQYKKDTLTQEGADIIVTDIGRLVENI